MKPVIKLLLCIVFAFLFSCSSDKKESLFNADRPYNPWVSRSVLDGQPRMITLALNDNLWASYHTENGALYKTWKGYVDFDGAVYTTAHGPQPQTVGDSYIVNQHATPWLIIEKGKETPAAIQYKGHRYDKGQVDLMYELSWGNGQKAMVFERPEYKADANGNTGFERRFTTSNVPQDVQIALKTNVSSIALQNQIKTNGDFQVINEKPRIVGDIEALDIDGKLILKSNGATTFTTFFTKKPLIENPNKSKYAAELEEKPSGSKLIDRSDCKTCHNTYRKTIGPGYVDIAKKYKTTEENIALLIHKVKNGGYGVWGSQVMSAHPDLPQADIRSMVEYILSLDKEEEAKEIVNPTKAPEEADYVFGAKIDGNELFPGAIARMYAYKKNITKLADLKSGGTLVSAGVIPKLQAGPEELTTIESNFSVITTGYIFVPKKGVYTFQLISDDGSQLIINDKQVIDHDGLHGADAKENRIALNEGYHTFRVEYFQGYGGKAIALKWKPEGSNGFEVIPRENLFHHPDDRPKATKTPLAMGATTRIPGDAFPLNAVHPSYNLSQARPMEFTPKVGGIDFLSDGRMVVSTWTAEGNVYILDNVSSDDPSQITYKTFATGFAEPLGLKVVDDEVYILQKQELTKLVDTNGDDVADEYQTVCNSWKVSSNFHEFAFGLAYKAGHFYATLATAIEPGGASTQPQIPDRGKVIKISKEDGSLEFVAHGLRTPNGIGLGMNNEIFVADNQGDWLPSSKIVHIKKGNWYGSRSVDFEGTANLKETLPVVWLPQDEIGNSPSTPIGLEDGPYKGQLMHGEVTHGGVKRVFVEKVNGEYQGCVFRFIQGLEAGVNRMIYGPDGALYVGGIGSTGNWIHNGKLWYGLQRLKYNEASTFEMLAIRAKSNGIEIEFTEPLNERDGWNTKDYTIQQWRYEPTAAYGGPKLDLENLKVKSASVSEDRKKVFLALDGMKANHLIYVHLEQYFVSELNHELWSTDAWYTMNQIPQNNPGTIKPAIAAVSANTLTDAEKAAGWQLLFDGKTTKGWRNFRKQTIGSSWVVKDGAIMLNSVRKDDGGWQAKDGGDIITEGQYENFELNLEWKIANCGNSGIMYNVVENDKYDHVWLTGPEMQILDNTCHPDSRYVTHRAGDLYDMIACTYETVTPANTWNKVKIIVNNGDTQFWLNGKKVVEFTMFNEEWTKMIANSKFKDMPDFGKARKGHISLQDHGDKVWFRNIKIREIKESI